MAIQRRDYYYEEIKSFSPTRDNGFILTKRRKNMDETEIV